MVSLIKRFFFLSLSLLALSNCAYAATNVESWRPVLGLEGGLDFAHVGKRQNVNLSTNNAGQLIGNTYTLDRASRAYGFVGGFFGAEKEIKPGIFWQLGLDVYMPSRQKVTGDVYQFKSPAFNNLNYKYYLRTTAVFLQTYLSKSFNKHFSPYVSAGVGMAYNEAYDYQETAKSSESVPGAPFASHKQANFAYSAGVGVDFLRTVNWTCGVGYRFVGLGSAALGRATGQTVGDRLETGNLYANNVMLRVTYRL